MATERFITKRFHPASVRIIDQANNIIAEYAAQGYQLTLRQLYYQFVARAYIENTLRSYKNLGAIINDARLAGLIDWEAIDDNLRKPSENWHPDGPKGAVQGVRDAYGIDMWENQDARVEVWVEKDALAGIVRPICQEWDVPFLACRGYVSQSAQWRAYRRILENAEAGITTFVLHLGDHDPSGIDMTRDNRDRLTMFLESQGLDKHIEVRRLALNADQVEQYNPPHNPAKMSDSRAVDYVRLHGHKSWELDALSPGVIAELVRLNVQYYIDPERWVEREDVLAADLEQLDKAIKRMK